MFWKMILLFNTCIAASYLVREDTNWWEGLLFGGASFCWAYLFLRELDQ